MGIIDKTKEYLKKLPSRSDKEKRVILWVIVGIFAFIMGSFWINASINRFSELEPININLGLKEAYERSDLDKIGGTLLAVPELIVMVDWQTYINKEFGFEIKIPEGWVVKTYPSNPEILEFTTDELIQKREDNLLNCKQGKECDAKELPYAIVIFNYIEKDGDKYSQGDLVNNEIFEIESSGIKWDRYLSQSIFFNVHFRTVDETKRGYDFSVFWETDEDTLKQILSTFKFIK